MKKKRVLPIVFIGITFMITGSAGAQSSSIDPKKVDLSTAKVIGVGVGSALPSLGATAASSLDPQKNFSYGFTTGTSKEKGSFQVGVLLADLQVAAQAGDRDRTKAACTALLQGLVSLEAPMPLIMSVTNLLSAIEGGVDIGAVAQLARPLLYAHVKAFIEEQGKLTYLFLGEWNETLYLAATVAAKGGKENVPMDLAVRASTFSTELKGDSGLPSGAVKALDDIAQLAKDKTVEPREASRMLKAAETLKMLFG